MNRASLPTMLIVDDEPLVRKSLRLIFKDEYQVVEASSGPEALTLVAAHLTPDIILCDISISIEMNGIQLVRLLRKCGMNSPVLFVSGMIDDRRLAEIRDMPLTGCIEKSYEVEQLRAAIDRLMNPRTAAS